jgi:hypothetical protein
MGIEIIMTTAFLLPVAAAARALARTAIARSGTLLAHCQDVMSASVLFNCCTQTGQSESGACAQSAPTQPPNRSYSPRHARDGARAAETQVRWLTLGFVAIMLIGFLAVVMTSVNGESVFQSPLWILVTVIAVAYVYSVRCKCPRCGKSVAGIYGRVPAACPYCRLDFNAPWP